MAGRKTKYGKDMLPLMLELYEKGESDASVCAELDISRQTFFRWYKTKKQFCDTVDRGRLLAERWWEQVGKSLATGTITLDGTRQQCRGNGRVWGLIMYNRFRQDYQASPEKQATSDNLDAIREAIQSALGGSK